MISQKPVLREHVTHFQIQFHQSVGVIETVSPFIDLLEEAKNDLRHATTVYLKISTPPPQKKSKAIDWYLLLLGIRSLSGINSLYP